MQKDHLNAQLQIAFPKSSEDQRLQLVAINGSIFAILHAPLESDGPIRLWCEDWSLILLAPIRSKSNIVISAINVFCFNEIHSEEGIVNLHASNQLIKFAHLAQSPEKFHQTCLGGSHQFDNDPGALLYYHRVFTNIVSSIQQNSFSDAQQMFIASLCTLAEKIKAEANSLDLHKVLKIWAVPSLRNP